jgi:hypothetical protein
VKTTFGISTAALLALTLVGSSSRAQEAVAPSSDDSGATASSQTPTTVSANSKVRIVRLSEVKGEVQIDRKTGQGFGGAMANLPVIEGDKLKTGAGVAEVEFEDNSTVRLAPNSLVEFPQLELLPNGAKASQLNVLQGMVYVSLVNTKGNQFIVTFDKEKLSLPPDSHIRLQVSSDQASVAVLHGDAVVEQPTGNTEVGKNKTMTLNLAGQSEPVIAKSVAEEPTDSWDKNSVDYHKSYANASSMGNSPYAYGLNDMNYYGSFINTGGCGGGSMWRPYFTSASWDPFGSGAWAYYPTAGYSWVSPYPWGWTPYHYGSWAYCQGVGWGWQPGGAWMGLANNSFVSPTRPRPPVHPPIAGQPALVAVNLKAIPASSFAAHDTFVFRKDSAGLGVPRGSLGKLNSFSGQTAQHGMASTNVYWSGQRGESGSGSRGENSGSGSVGTASSRSYSTSTMQSAPASAASHGSGGAGGGSGRH